MFRNSEACTYLRQQNPANNEGLFVSGTYEPTADYPGSQLVDSQYPKIQLRIMAANLIILFSWKQITPHMQHGMSAQTNQQAGVRALGSSPGAPLHQKKPFRKDWLPSVDMGCFHLWG